MTGGLALGPECLARAAEESDFAGGYGLVESLAVHITEHQHFKGYCILNDGWD